MMLFLFTLIAASGRLYAQAGATGTILGTVSDSTGAMVPNANVTVTNTATGAVVRMTTSSSGDYQASSLNPGTYSVSAEMAGFQKSVTSSFTLAVDQRIRVNVALKTGAVTETVEVMAQALALDTDSSAIGQLVSQKQVEELPLNGRNFMQLLLLGAGAVTVGGEQGTMRQGSGNAISINGARPESNNYTLDGLINTDTALVTPAVILSQDAIQEFKVESGSYPAEFGFSANQINLVSKSGTNKIHGTVFEFNRNNVFDASPFPTAADYQSGINTGNPKLRQNQFGFVADGPVYLPKLYDGRNKTFWMANYEGWRIINGIVEKASVPNPAVLGGDFSAENLPAYGTAACTKNLASSLNCLPVDPLTGQPFPGNKIPSDRITSRLATAAIGAGFWPTPNAGATNAAPGTVNFVKSVGLPLVTNQQTYRVDQTLGKFGLIFGRYTYSTYQNSSLNSASLVYGLETQYEKQKNWEISHTISLGTHSTNNFRFGYLDASAPQGATTPPQSFVTSLGLSGIFQKYGPLQLTYPNIGLSQYAGTGGPVNAYTGSDQPAWEFADSYSWVKGRNTFGFGGDYRRWRLIRNLDDDFLGDYGFSSATIGNNKVGCSNSTGDCGTGNAVADMLLGYYSNAAGYVPGPLSPTDQAGNPQTHIFSYFAPYAQDDIKVTQRLTLNVGLRWDYRAAPYEEKNHFFWLDDQNKQGGLCYADKTLGTNGVASGVGLDGVTPILRYCGSNVPHPGSKTPFAPRFGFAYNMGEKTVIRGGYGIFWDSSEGREIDDSGDIYPYAIRNSLSPATNPAAPKLTNNLFPSFGTLGPFPVSTLTFLAVIESDNPLNPYVQQWSLSTQRSLSRNTTLELNYIGSKGTHLLTRHDIAQPNAIPANELAFCDTQDANGKYINSGVAPCTPNSRLPYPNFTNIYINSDWHGYSNYNSFNTKFEHRTSSLAVTAIYTWAKSMDDKSAAAGVGASGAGYQGFMDNHNPNLDYGPSDFDVNQRFVTSYVYDLPIGRGKKVLGQVNRATDVLVGGWELTGITTLQTGFPFGINSADPLGYTGSIAPRASYIPGCNIHSGLTAQFQRLNMSCFYQSAPGVFGNTGRNFLRQPGINNFDIGLAKSIAITEQMRVAFRVDTFNTFNHHQYAINVGGLATGGSGGGSAIDNGLTDSLAGKITSSSPGRVIQLSGKLTF
ncbi:TonB-dependent receptor [Edaphobacter paludis]|uniref:TonB-dependent receptor n=1 Tax=Edaphobacter paludis TaxID=3035702 RepID=A0AAU7CY31_9BACT